MENFLRQLKLIQRVSFGFYLFIVLLLILVFFFYSVSNTMTNDIRKNYEKRIEMQSIAYSINKALKKIEYLAIKNSISADYGYMKKIDSVYTKEFENINKLKKNEYFSNNKKAISLINHIAVRVRGYRHLSSVLKDEMDNSKEDGIYAILALVSANKMIDEDMNKLFNIINHIAKDNEIILRKHFFNLKIVIFLSVFAFLVFMIFLNKMVTASIILDLKVLEKLTASFFDYLSGKKESIAHKHFDSKNEITDIINIVDSNLYIAENLVKREREEAKRIEQKVKEATKEIIALNKELESTQREVIFTMGAIAEERSKETGDHVKRVAEYSFILARLYGLSKEESLRLKDASPMHDIGKIAIPDAVLKKPGKLTDDEFKIMQSHAEVGYKMLNVSTRPILKAAAIVAYEHHEKYNGRGYPRGLKGEEIHIYGRITAIADVFDALGSDRVYKKAWPLEKICKLLEDERGEHFDPELVDLFLDNLPHFIAARENIEMYGSNEKLSKYIENFETFQDFNDL